MIEMPPRHGKSELASIRFPGWFLGRNPKRSMISASYNSDLASDFGRAVRNLVASPEYSSVFDVKLAQDSAAANRWHTSEKGSYVAAGVGTATTGRGAHVLGIDDPFKDREAADSETIREKVWRWYTSTAYTRLEGDFVGNIDDEDDELGLWRQFHREIQEGAAQPFEGAIILINTRWHDDDLSGRLLEAQDNGGDEWDRLVLPAIADENTGRERALWPVKYPMERLKKIRGAIGSRDWQSLYQQDPTPDEGLFFKREWIKEYAVLPDDVHFYGASDYAVSDGKGDWTVHVVGGVDNNGNLYVHDMWRGQTVSDVWIESVIDLYAQYEPMDWAEEQGQIIKSVGPFLERRMNERNTFCARTQFTSTMDKSARARTLQARMASGKVFFRSDMTWLAGLYGEMLTFPAGKHDDQVDALALLGRLLVEMVGKRLVNDENKSKDRWDKAFDKQSDESDSWKTL